MGLAPELRKHFQLDATDLAKIAEALNTIEKIGGINVRTILFDVYGQHRVRASKRGRWGALRVRKIERLP